MARILLIGGHGKVALLLEPLLVSRGDHVTAVIRNADHEAEVAATGATPVVADIERLDTEQLANLLSANDAVVWSAGAGGGSPERTYAVDRDAAIRTIDAAVAADVRRYVMVSYFGARPDHGVPPENGFFAYAEAKAAADAHLRASGLDWTIVAPSSLTLDQPTGRIDVDAAESGTVARGDVAAVIAAVLADDSTVRRTLRFNAGDVPIADAIRG
ncbi:NAD(P)H-binding protein [Microbacterium saccharophilum]|uniref:NAD(P)H-binding protein n=1 Tax=Microbacterium saccharophilum TaxID=1213358 RepID=A0A5C8I166_9MICO|nr:NAD(P)H-binding protein [Microbacterium saccharophilum]TXK11453.1 NAD(P)H-binding protein [Microbacterium saccharophilum]GEP48500.1 NAD-dependent dehydratase [Microbacterium saccharophilum]